MTRQERNVLWIGLGVLCGLVLLAELLLAPDTPAKALISLGCAAVVGYAIYRVNRRRRRNE